MVCQTRHGPLVKRLRHRPLTPITGVRFPHGSPKWFPVYTGIEPQRESRKLAASRNPIEMTAGGARRLQVRADCRFIVGVDYGEGPPVPIPNTEVKLTGADDTWLATARDNR